MVRAGRRAGAVNFVTPFSRIGVAELRGCDMWFSGSDTGWSEAERQSLSAWLAGPEPRYLIATCSDGRRDVCRALGVPASTAPPPAAALTSLDAPLRCGGGTTFAPTAAAAASGAAASFDWPMANFSEAAVLASYPDGQPAVVTNSLTNSRWLLLGVLDLLGSGSVSGGKEATATPADVFALNVFKFALDALSPRRASTCPSGYVPPRLRVCSKAGEGDISPNGLSLARARSKLTNQRIFGRRGAVGFYQFEFLGALARVESSALARCDIWFSGGGSLNATEVAALGQWVRAGGHFLIGGCDAPGRDAACRAVVRHAAAASLDAPD
jgi:hypothetical protein